MRTIYDEACSAFNLGERLASGGQGVVWRLAGFNDHLVKIYHNQLSIRETDKQRFLRTKAEKLKKVAALPISLAFSDSLRTKHIGIFLPYIGGSEVFELYGTRSRLEHFPRAGFKFLVQAAYNLAAAFEDLHAQGIVVGDVNERNIKVLPDATVRFIDTDSFQIRNGTEVYTSDVGTPIWTAPELHGINLTGFERTQNHDLFGLAQMIFLILFAGRHPFSGVPKTKQHLLPEEAIRLHAFAFAPAEMGIPLAPPPGSPRMEMLPNEIRAAFFQAFLKESVHPHARPSASRWRQILDEFGRALITCSRNSAHTYWNKAISCPWCGIIREAGVDIFPASTVQAPITATNPASNDAYILRLTTLKPHSFSITIPPPFINLNPSPLPQSPKGLWSDLHQIFSAKSWKKKWLEPLIESCKSRLLELGTQIASAQAEQQNIINTYNKEYLDRASPLHKIILALKNNAGLYTEYQAVIKGERQRAALRVYLQRFRLRQYKIPQIGPSRLTTILSFGIETAADIDRGSLTRAGLPSNAVDELIYWRQMQESHFKFDPNQPLSASEIQDVERRVHDKIKKLKEEAASIEVKLNEASSQAGLKLRVLEAKIQQLNHKREQARVDLQALQRELSLS